MEGAKREGMAEKREVMHYRNKGWKELKNRMGKKRRKEKRRQAVRTSLIAFSLSVTGSGFVLQHKGI